MGERGGKGGGSLHCWESNLADVAFHIEAEYASHLVHGDSSASQQRVEINGFKASLQVSEPICVWGEFLGTCSTHPKLGPALLHGREPYETKHTELNRLCRSASPPPEICCMPTYPRACAGCLIRQDSVKGVQASAPLYGHYVFIKSPPAVAHISKVTEDEGPVDIKATGNDVLAVLSSKALRLLDV